jgi:hypothetical protein
MKKLLVSLFIAASASLCHAQGWLDFKLDIGDGYAIWRNNSRDVNVANSNDTVLMWSDRTGPVVAYATTERFIFTRNRGNDPESDPDQEFFFVLTKGTDEFAGPLTKREFENRPETKTVSQIKWLKPTNPNFWRPVLGTLMFFLFAIPILAIKFFWVTIPVIIVLVLLIRDIRKQRKQNAR